MSSEEADVAVPVMVILALIAGLGVYHSITKEEPQPTPQEIQTLLDEPASKRVDRP